MNYFYKQWQNFLNYWFPPAPAVLAPTVNVKWEVAVNGTVLPSWLKGASVTIRDITDGVDIVHGVTGPSGYFTYPDVGLPGVVYPRDYINPAHIYEVDVEMAGYEGRVNNFTGPVTRSEVKPGFYNHEFEMFSTSVVLPPLKGMDIIIARKDLS